MPDIPVVPVPTVLRRFVKAATPVFLGFGASPPAFSTVSATAVGGGGLAGGSGGLGVLTDMHMALVGYEFVGYLVVVEAGKKINKFTLTPIKINLPK